MTEWHVNDSELVMNQKNTGRYSNTTCSVLQNEHDRPDTFADKHRQNINWLFCNNQRGDEAPAFSNANKMALTSSAVSLRKN